MKNSHFCFTTLSKGKSISIAWLLLFVFGNYASPCIAQYTTTSSRYFQGMWKANPDDDMTIHFDFTASGYLYIYEDGDLVSGEATVKESDYDDDVDDDYDIALSSKYHIADCYSGNCPLTITLWYRKAFHRKSRFNELDKVILYCRAEIAHTNKFLLHVESLESTRDDEDLMDDFGDEPLVFYRTNK